MSHEVETMMYNQRGGVPWHGLGEPVDGLATAELAIEKSGLDWEVELRQSGFKTAAGNWRVAPGRFHIVRTTDEKPFGSVSKRYVPIQNVEAFNFIDALVDSDEAKFDTAGALRGGKQVFLSAVLPDDVEIAGGEKFTGHLLLTNEHTGLSAVTVRYVQTRVVCANTLAWAHGEAVPVWSFPHVTGIEERLEQARETLSLVTAYQKVYAQQVEQMLAIELELKEMSELLTKALPERMGSDKNKEAILANVFSSPTISDDTRKTGWGLINGFTEWAEHLRPIRGDDREGRFHDVVDGAAARTRDRMVKLVLA